MTASEYFTQLGLEADPLAADAMPEFFFVGGQRRFLAQRAAQSVYFSGSIVLLLGANGAGKTRMLDEVVAELRDVADICRIDATVLMNGGDIRQQLAAGVNLPPQAAHSNTELLFALDRSRPAAGEPQPILLIIDAAQLLSIETLTECAALIQGAGGRLRLLLAGESDLATAWQQGHCGDADILQLQPLDAVDTADYLHTRLQAAGCTASIPFAPELLAELYAQSGGNIGAIHKVAPQLLTPTQIASNTPAMSRLPLLHIGIAAGLLTIVILLLIYRNGDDDPSSAAAVIKSESDHQAIPLSLPTSPSTPPTPVNKPAIATANPSASTIAAPAPAPAPKPVEKPIAKPAVEPVAQPEPTPAPKIVPDNGAFDSDERALLALPAQQVMLQVIGAEARASVDKFAASAGKEVKLYVYSTRLRGKPWHIALTGPYADKNTAAAAVQKLPEAIRKQQPWPRSIANIQADIRAHSAKH